MLSEHNLFATCSFLGTSHSWCACDFVYICMYTLHFPVYRHYNLELFMPESTFELLRSGFHFENPNVNYFSVMVSDGIVCLSLCQPQISYFQFKQIQNNSKIVLSSNILLTTEMKKK